MVGWLNGLLFQQHRISSSVKVKLQRNVERERVKINWLPMLRHCYISTTLLEWQMNRRVPTLLRWELYVKTACCSYLERNITRWHLVYTPLVSISTLYFWLSLTSLQIIALIYLVTSSILSYYFQYIALFINSIQKYLIRLSIYNGKFYQSKLLYACKQIPLHNTDFFYIKVFF